MMETKRILVVDDSSSHRMLLTKTINEHPNLEVVGEAENGLIGTELVKKLKPDLVTLDIQMPVMSGLQALQEIHRDYPDIPCIMVSVLTGSGAEAALNALALGARECIEKPRISSKDGFRLSDFKEELQTKILAIASSNYCPSIDLNRNVSHIASHSNVSPTESNSSTRTLKKNKPQILAIGTSTGGPDALSHLLQEMPSNYPIPIVIVQHMPIGFTGKLARRLDQLSHLRVLEAQQGDIIEAGSVYIAPGDYHMTLESKGARVSIALDQDDPENSCRPAVDKLFRSVAQIYSDSSLGVVLTGMGRDGFKGAQAMADAGAEILVQDENSSVVWGMPGYVARSGLADSIVSLDEMSEEIVHKTLNNTNSKKLENGQSRVDIPHRNISENNCPIRRHS